MSTSSVLPHTYSHPHKGQNCRCLKLCIYCNRSEKDPVHVPVKPLVAEEDKPDIHISLEQQLALDVWEACSKSHRNDYFLNIARLLLEKYEIRRK